MRSYERFLQDFVKPLENQEEATEFVTHLFDSIDRLAENFGVTASEDLVKMALIEKLWEQVAEHILSEFPRAAIQNSVYPFEHHRRLVAFFQPEAKCGFGIGWSGPLFNGAYWGVFRRHEYDDTFDIASKLAILFEGRQPIAAVPWWRWACPTSDILPMPINWEDDLDTWREILTGRLSQRLVSVAKNFRAIIHDTNIL